MYAKEHYDKHLGNFYSWTVGEFEANQKEQEAFFKRNLVTPMGNSIALDLGAGHGFQAVSLANLGFKVTAIDFNKQLIHELQQRSKGKSVTIIEGDLRNSSLYEHMNPEVIVCMGDTITHLHTMDEVKNVIHNASNILPKEGKFIVSFRDLTSELSDRERFIPVRSDDNRIHTCFMEYFDDHVAVTDILHEKEKGHWTQKISAYRKLRISQAAITEIIESSGLRAIHSEINKGMISLIAQKTVI